MRTLVEVVARRGLGGRTVLPVVRASGQFAVRRTGPATVHLIATAFGPLGGDDAELRVVVEEGATLTVCSAAAAVALPARGTLPPPSVQRVHAQVDGALDLRCEPTVVAAGAHHRASLTARLGPAGELTATERVLLGRSGELPGRWTGSTRIERDGVPILHTTVGLGPGASAWLPPVAPRAYACTVHLGAGCPVGPPVAPPVGPQVGVETAENGVRLPLPGGWVSTAWGVELHHVVRTLDALDVARRVLA